jgi:hypothetical protein
MHPTNKKGITMSQETTAAATEPVKPERTPRPKLNLGEMQASLVSAKTVAERRRTVNRTAKPRSNEQKAIDGLVKQVHDKWVAKGRPTKWGERDGAQVVLPAEQLESLRAAVYSAGTFLGVRVRFGSITTITKDGKEYADVLFTVIDAPQPEAQPEAQPEGRPEGQPETKPEAKPGVKK